MEVARVGIKKRRTRGGETEASSGTNKRTKMANDGELTLSPTLIQLRSSAGDVMTRSENSTSPCLDDPPTVSDYCYVPHTSDHLAVTSCCSSNSSSEFDNDSLQNLDLQLKSDETVHTSEFNCRESREITPASELEVESVSFVSASQPLEAATKIPSESELEEFFSAAEKNIQEQFMEKYNYDIAKDAPLEGRYEWIQMKP